MRETEEFQRFSNGKILKFSLKYNTITPLNIKKLSKIMNNYILA